MENHNFYGNYKNYMVFYGFLHLLFSSTRRPILIRSEFLRPEPGLWSGSVGSHGKWWKNGDQQMGDENTIWLFNIAMENPL